MLGTPFLTTLDPRAKIKGSRDPLGLQPIWTRLGRQIVQNLTTVTTSVRAFTTLLLGLYFAEQLSEERSAADQQSLAAFLKFEQLAAYSRVARSANAEAYDEDEIRGIQRVRSNLSLGAGRVRISADSGHQILSNQKTYGLWGLYMVAARNSGWLEPALPRLRPAARDFVAHVYLPRLEKGRADVEGFLRSNDKAFEPNDAHARLARRLTDVLSLPLRPEERDFYTRHLLAGGESDGRQALLWDQMRAVNGAGRFDWLARVSDAELAALIRQAAEAGHTSLAQRLEHIRRAEAAISPAGHVFRFMLTRDGQPVQAVAAEVRAAWGGGLRHVDPAAVGEALAVAGEALSMEARARLRQAAEALADGDYARLVMLLLDHNQDVMQARGGAPWVRLTNGRLDVRFQDEVGELPPRESLPDLWHPYFLSSLKRVGYQIQEM